MIRRCTFERAVRLVEDSGAAGYVEELMRPAGKGGRPRQITFAVFLAAVICSVGEEPNLSLVRVHKTLTTELAYSYQVALNIIDRRTKRTLTLRQVRYMLEALERKLAHTQGRAPDLSDDERESRASALQHVIDMLIGATIPVHLSAPGAYALDGTAVESWAKGRGRRKVDPEADHADDDRTDAVPPDDDPPGTVVSFDPDAAYGYQTKTYDNKTNHCFGYHAFALVGVPPVGADPDSWPKLVERLAVRPANANAVEPSMAMLDSMLDLGRPVTELLSDREFSFRREEAWAIPLRDRGIRQVFDMHAGDRGVRDYNGIAMIDGIPHCRAVMGERFDVLERIPRPVNLSPGTLKKNPTPEERAEHQARIDEINAFRALIAEREIAAFRRVAGPDESGKERYECPAQAGQVICANCPFSQDLPDGIPVVAEPHRVPDLPPEPERPTKMAAKAEKDAYRAAKAEWDKQADYLRCCRQRTVTIPGNVVAKLRQPLAWGSDAWIASYGRRGHIEGAFGNYKSPKTADLKRGWVFLVGIVKTSLMLAAVAVATNIRLLRKWADRTGDRTHPLTAVDPVDHGFEERDADGNPDLALAPPVAA